MPTLPAIVETLADRRYDLVHVCSPGPAGVAALLVARTMELPDARLVPHRARGLRGLRSGDPLLRPGCGRALGTFYGPCDAVLSPGERRRHVAFASSGSRRRVARWDRGVDVARFAPGAPRASPGGDLDQRPLRRAADPGEGRRPARRRVPRRPGARPAAAPRARRRRPRGGALRDRLGEHATFLGWLEGDALAAAYASADVFLFCSQTDTFGQVILEAQASGLPVVAVAAGGPAELIADGRSGVLCPPRADDSPTRSSSLAGSRAAPRAAGARRARRRRRPLLGGQPRPAGRRLAPRAHGQHRARARGRRSAGVIEAGLAPARPRRRRRGRRRGAVRGRHRHRRRRPCSSRCTCSGRCSSRSPPARARPPRSASLAIALGAIGLRLDDDFDERRTSSAS